jgi:hypothetical protein
MKIFSLSPAFSIALAVLVSTAVEVDAAPAPARQWDLVDVGLNGPAGLPAPLDVDAVAHLQGPDGERMKVPLFFNGGTEFVLRFTPPSPGLWRFKTESTVAALSGLTGAIKAEAAAAGRRGAVGVSPADKQRFAHADGTPYFPIAFECDWLFALDALNKKAIPKTRTLVKHIAENGFNQVVMNVYAYDVTWPKDPNLKPEYDYARPAYSPFGGDNENPDHSTLNLAFFRHLDRVVRELDENGIVAHLMIYVWNKQVNWPEARSPEDNRYFDYVVKRYQAFPNLVWDISKEALGYGHNDVTYITDRIARLRSLDAFQRLVTVHDFGYCSKQPGQVDFVSVQMWTSELYSAMKEIRAKHPGKPIFNIEHGGYEAGPYHVFTGDYLSADTCLERAYQCVFAGVYPTHYWQDTSWSVVIHDPDALPAGQRPKLRYYRHLADFVSGQGLAELEPAKKKFSGSGHCLTDGKNRFVYYFPKENDAIHVRLNGREGQKLKASWFDPHTGESMDLGTVRWQKYNEFQSPGFDHFAILNIELLP